VAVGHGVCLKPLKSLINCPLRGSIQSAGGSFCSGFDPIVRTATICG
jgi:hypothetical protein